MARIVLSSDQEHYLKKELLNIQLHREFNKLSPTYHDVTGLRRFGPPFWPFDPKKPPANKAEAIAAAEELVDYYDVQFPLLRHFFTEFVMTFPFLEHHARVHKSGDMFWVDKVQKFFELWKAKQISNSNDRGELSKRKLLLQKFLSFMLMLYNSSLVTLGDDEYFSKDATRNSYKKFGKVVPLELDMKEILKHEDHFVSGLALNVCAVTQAQEEKKLKKLTGFWNRSAIPKTSHFYQFVIEVKDQKTGETYFVRRRYSEFVRFDHQLGKHFPGQDLPVLPTKFKISTEVDVTSIEEGSDPEELGSPQEEHFEFNREALDAMKMEQDTEALQHTLSESFSSISVSNFPREKLRVALRGYLMQLLRIPAVRSSELFKEFLLRDKCSSLTTEELTDREQRRKLDDLIVVQQIRFQQETIHAISELQLSINALKNEVLDTADVDAEKGLMAVFREIEAKETISQLSPHLKAFIEVAKIEVASTIYEILIANDNSMANLHIYKTLHRFFPYRFVATILRFTNPMQVAKKLIDLFTLQSPLTLGIGSGMSLLQWMFTGMLNDDVKHLQKEIELIADKIIAHGKAGLKGNSYSAIVSKIDEYLAAKDEVVIDIKKTCQEFNLDLPLGLLMNHNALSTKLSHEVIVAIVESYKSWVVYDKMNDYSDDDTHVDSDEFTRVSQAADLYINIKAYFKNCIRRRDKDGMKELWEEPELVQLVKEIISIFFEPLIKIFTKAQLYLYIPIIREFNSELIKLVDNYHNDYNALLGRGNNVVMQFMGLLTKYQEHLYRFIHHLYISDLQNPDGQVFRGLIVWFNKFIVLLNSIKRAHPELKMDLTRSVNEYMAQGHNIDPDKLLAEIERIIQGVRAKKEVYDKVMAEQAEGNGILNEKDALAADRKKVVTKNWERINQNFTSIFDSDGTGAMKMTGLSEADLDELNMEFLETSELSKEDSVAVKLPVSEFLARLDHSTSSSDRYIKSEEFEDVYDNPEIMKLSDMFGGMVEKTIRAIRSYQ